MTALYGDSMKFGWEKKCPCVAGVGVGAMTHLVPSLVS